MRNKRAKQLRRMVRKTLQMPTIRLDGVDVNKVGEAGYIKNMRTLQIKLAPGSSRQVYQFLKHAYKKQPWQQREITNEG